MLKIEKILCPVDFSEFSARAYDYAYSLTKHYRAKLFLEHVVQPLTAAYAYYAFPDSVNQVYWNLDAHAELRLHELAASHTRNGVHPEFVVQKGFIPDAILSFAQKQATDLIVMGTHGTSGVDRLLLGSVTEKILRKARCPVLAVRKPAHDFVTPDDAEPVHLHKILLCTDFSPHSERASFYAFSLAQEYGAELSLLHVLEDISGSSDLRYATEESIIKLEKLIPCGAARWCAAKPIVRLGKPYQQINQLALETETDLVVLGVRGRNAVDLALFGSTAHRVIQLGPCPVLAVHI